MIEFKQMAMVALLSIGIGLTGISEAALYNRGGGLVYDDSLNITWLQDANYAKTSGYDSDGNMNWSNAQNWVANLIYHDSVRNVDYNDWRLPTVTYPCIGNYNCTTESELGYLFYNELGGTAGQSIVSNHDANYNMFSNVEDFAYWSGTEGTPIEAGEVYVSLIHNGPKPTGNHKLHFNFRTGFSGSGFGDSYLFSWAVRTGDVTAVPVQGAVWFFGSGLCLLSFTRLKKRNRTVELAHSEAHQS